MISQVPRRSTRGNTYGFMGLGHHTLGEESAAHPHVRLVVFHHRGGISVAGDQPMVVGAAGGIGAGATGGVGGVCVVWGDVLGESLLTSLLGAGGWWLVAGF